MIDLPLQSQLQKHPFVEGFQPAHLKKLAELATPVKWERDQVIFHEGDECHEFYLIISGLIALEVEERDHTLRVQTLTGGDELGWSALLMAAGKHFQARVLQPVEAISFDANKLLAMIREDPAFGVEILQRLLGVVAGRLHHTRLQLHDMYSPVAKRSGT